MNKKLFMGCIYQIDPLDVTMALALIQEPGEDKYRIVFSSNYTTINGDLVEITDYDTLDIFGSVEGAVRAMPAGVIALKWHLQECAEEAIREAKEMEDWMDEPD